MYRFIALLFSLLIFQNITAQENLTLQLSGGIISPFDASSGLAGNVQLNYNVSENLELYFNTGYSKWYENNILYSNGYRVETTVYDEDNHRMIPIEIGTRYMFNENKLFETFFDAQIGMCYLVYDHYKIQSRVNPDGKTEVYVDGMDQADVEQYLLSLGVGLGVMRKIADNIKLIVGTKVKTIVNSDYNGFDFRDHMYFLFYFGFGFNI